MGPQTQTNEKITLEVSARDTLGKQTRSLRNKGIIPGNIYGKKFTSQAIAIDEKIFSLTYKKAGETTVVYVKMGESTIPTLISEIQYHPVTGEILHVDFHKVDLKQKVEAAVPFAFVGVSEAVEKKNGVLITQLEEITVSALPTDIPHEIEVDISRLTEIGDAIKVADLTITGNYEIKDDPQRSIVSVTEHKEEELEPETAAPETEITGEAGAAAAEGVEGTEGAAAAGPEEQTSDKKETK